MSKLFKRDDEAIVTCVVCRNLLEQPILLSCLHNVCRACIGDISAPAAHDSGSDGGSRSRGEQAQGTSVTCPRCKETHSMDAKRLAKTNTHVAARIARIQTELRQQASKHCSVCRENRLGDVPGTHRCPECRLLLCDDCTKDHARFMRGHDVVPVSSDCDEAEQGPGTGANAAAAAGARVVRECGEHGKPLSYFCKTCNSLACSVCLQLKCSREEHHFTPAEVACDDAKKELLAALNRVTSSPGLRLVREAAASSKTLLEGLQAARRNQLESMRRKRIEAERDIVDMFEKAEQRVLEHSLRQEAAAIECEAAVARIVSDESEQQLLPPQLLLPEIEPMPPIVAECMKSMEELLAKFVDSVRITNLSLGTVRRGTSDDGGSQQPPSPSQ